MFVSRSANANSSRTELVSVRFSISSNSAGFSSVNVWSFGLRCWFATRQTSKTDAGQPVGCAAVENLRAAHSLE
jgi:hypothetical protein